MMFECESPGLYKEFIMNLQTIRSKLRAFYFNIVCVKQIDRRQQILSDCGAVINIYDNGAVACQQPNVCQ